MRDIRPGDLFATRPVKLIPVGIKILAFVISVDETKNGETVYMEISHYGMYIRRYKSCVGGFYKESWKLLARNNET